LRNRADPAVDFTAAHPKRRSTGDANVVLSGLHIFVTALMWGCEVFHDAEAAFDRRALSRRDDRMLPPPGAAGASGWLSRPVPRQGSK
jgi:hypothetical protein